MREPLAERIDRFRSRAAVAREGLEFLREERILPLQCLKDELFVCRQMTAEPPVIHEIRVPAARNPDRFPAIKLSIRAFTPGNDRAFPLPVPVVIVVEPEFGRRFLF